MVNTLFKSLFLKKKSKLMPSRSTAIDDTIEFEPNSSQMDEMSEIQIKISGISSRLFVETKEREKRLMPFFHSLNKTTMNFQRLNEEEWKEHSYQKSLWRKQLIEWTTFQALWVFTRNWLEEEDIRLNKMTNEVVMIEKKLNEWKNNFTFQGKIQQTDPSSLPVLIHQLKKQMDLILKENSMLNERMNEKIIRINESIMITDFMVTHELKTSFGKEERSNKKQMNELFKQLNNVQKLFSMK